MTPRQLMKTPGRRTCPWTGRSASVPEYSMTGISDITVGVAYEYLDAGEAEIDQEGRTLTGFSQR